MNLALDIGNTNVNEVSLVALIRADLERNGGLLDLLPTLSEIEASTVIAKASDINALNDITAGEVVTAMQSVADDFKADVTSINNDVTAIKNKTDNLPDDPAKESSVQTSIAVSV